MPSFSQSANSLYLLGFNVPPFLVLTEPSLRVAFSSPGQVKLDCHFRSAGGLQTVKTNLRSTPCASAIAFKPSTTGFCLTQSASCPALSGGGKYSFRQIVIPRSLITFSPQSSFHMLPALSHQTSCAPKNPKPSMV